MRRSLALLLAVAIGVAVFLVLRDDDAATTSSSPVTLVGDSLNVGIEPYLGRALEGRTVDAHDRVGRATADGVDVLSDLGSRLAPVVVVSLGTNDADGSEAEFRALVDRALELVGGDRCLVWATIVRDGSARAGFNAILARAASGHRNVRLVDWASLVAQDPELLASDAVHGTPEGYRRRAEATARAVEACPSVGS
jgi:lysophospholipase L1-like esterase